MGTACKRDWMTREEAEAFIGKNAPFYMESWKQHSSSTLKGWNWAAMFFGIEWMAYRKMYMEAMITFVAVACVSVITVFLLGIDGGYWGDCFRILIGVFGNMLYRNKALRAIHKVEEQNTQKQLEALSNLGGVSPVAVVMMCLLEVAYFVCLLV